VNFSEYEFVVVAGLAISIDLLLGEPPNRFHPVAWMGTAIGWGKRLGVGQRPGAAFAIGWLIVLLGGAVSASVGWAVEQWFGAIVQALLLTCCIGVRSLSRAGACVRKRLAANDLPGAREQLSLHLVSRDTSLLSASEVSAAAIESVAENTSDSVVAPLFFYAVGGLPAALVYRFVNTCDAMLGYRTTELEWLGKPAARLDDLLNWVPARVTAIAMGMVAMSARGFRTWWADAGRTPSPNGGHPMSMAAGVLDVCLEKQGCYTLGAGLRAPVDTDIDTMQRLYWRTVSLSAVAIIGGCWAWRGVA
jgi:adenosylcobinamide-phosphate synthase